MFDATTSPKYYRAMFKVEGGVFGERYQAAIAAADESGHCLSWGGDERLSKLLGHATWFFSLEHEGLRDVVIQQHGQHPKQGRPLALITLCSTARTSIERAAKLLGLASSEVVGVEESGPRASRSYPKAQPEEKHERPLTVL